MKGRETGCYIVNPSQRGWIRSNCRDLRSLLETLLVQVSKIKIKIGIYVNIYMILMSQKLRVYGKQIVNIQIYKLIQRI